MNMIKESYERLTIDVTKFDVEDVITTSGIGPDDPHQQTPPPLGHTKWEMPVM